MAWHGVISSLNVRPKTRSRDARAIVRCFARRNYVVEERELRDGRWKMEMMKKKKRGREGEDSYIDFLVIA